MKLPPCLDAFPEVWAADFEYRAENGGLPQVHCGVLRELRTDRPVRLLGEQLRRPPAMHPQSLYVAYYASAEMGCHLALNWPLPRNVLDLYVEFKNHINGRELQLHLLSKGSKGLLGALAFFGLSHMDPDTKSNMRDVARRGGPFTAQERIELLAYCELDVDALQALLWPLVGALVPRGRWLEHALLRGDYMKAVARMERNGTPLDTDTLHRLRANWAPLKTALVETIVAEYPVYTEGPAGYRLDQAKLQQWALLNGIAWPRSDTGRLKTDKETLRKLEKAFPIVASIREVQSHLGAMILNDLHVGPDGRNRTLLSPFHTHTGRNQPSTSRFIYGPGVWVRFLIKPEPGRAVAYLDWSSQEIAVSGALSGDTLLMDDYASGDPYIRFARAAGTVPPDATKETHEKQRDQVKQVVLGTNYGMQGRSVAAKAGIWLHEALALLKQHRGRYKTFWAWSQRVIDAARITGHLDTVFGFRMHVRHYTKDTSLLNHPMQSNGAEMLRIAAVLMTEDGIQVCAPVHDAFLIEDTIENIDATVARAQAHMLQAARIVVGMDVRTDAKIVRYPDRYADKRGAAIWALLMGHLERLESKHKRRA